MRLLTLNCNSEQLPVIAQLIKSIKTSMKSLNLLTILHPLSFGYLGSFQLRSGFRRVIVPVFYFQKLQFLKTAALQQSQRFRFQFNRNDKFRAFRKHNNYFAFEKQQYL